MSSDFNFYLRTIVMPAIKGSLPGYSRPGRTFRKPVNDVEHLVNVQTGISWGDLHSFTVNVGVVSLPIFRVHWTHDYKRSIGACQWHQRVGWYRQDRHDVWWPLRNEEEARKGVEECVPLMKMGLEEMNGLNSTRKLLEYWEAGGWGGLGEAGREMYIRLAKQVLAVPPRQSSESVDATS